MQKHVQSYINALKAANVRDLSLRLSGLRASTFARKRHREASQRRSKIITENCLKGSRRKFTKEMKLAVAQQPAKPGPVRNDH